MIPVPNQPEVPTHARAVALAIYPQEPRVVLTVELLKITEETVTTETTDTTTYPTTEDPAIIEGAESGEPTPEENTVTDPNYTETPMEGGDTTTEPAPEPEPTTTTVVHEKRLGVKQIEITGSQVGELMSMAPVGATMYDCIKHAVYVAVGANLIV